MPKELKGQHPRVISIVTLNGWLWYPVALYNGSVYEFYLTKPATGNTIDAIFLVKSDSKNSDVFFRVLLFVMEKSGLIVKFSRQESKWE